MSIPKNLSILLASGFYSGLSPLAPGTVGSLVYLILAYLLGSLVLVPLFPGLSSISAQSLYLTALFVVSIAVTQDSLDKKYFVKPETKKTALENSEQSKEDKHSDPKQIVIDEFLGMATTLAFSSYSPLSLLLAFTLFRTFDVLKPYPICQVEKLPGAWGVVLDDLLAGVAAGLCLLLIQRNLGLEI